jgi:hypothetical protein
LYSMIRSRGWVCFLAKNKANEESKARIPFTERGRGGRGRCIQNKTSNTYRERRHGRERICSEHHGARDSGLLQSSGGGCPPQALTADKRRTCTNPGVQGEPGDLGTPCSRHWCVHGRSAPNRGNRVFLNLDGLTRSRHGLWSE